MNGKKSAPSTDKPDRRRGRPAGKNRTPLSLEERRARNAQYERERRNETADAMAHLAEAAGCDPQIANAELLATVISQFQRRAKKKVPEDIENLRRINENLESQIAMLQSRLGQDIDVSNEEDLNDCEPDEPIDNFESYYQTDEPIPKESEFQLKTSQAKRKYTIQKRQKEMQRSNKIRKTSKSKSVNEKIDESDSDTQSDSSSNSNWSTSVRTAPTQYELRNRSQKVSEQSECTTSTYPYRTSESSQSGTVSEQTLSSNSTNRYGTSRSRETSLKFDSDDSNQSDSENPGNMIDPNVITAPDQDEDIIQYDKQTESALLNDLTEGEMSMLNQWLDGSETLNIQSDHEVDNRVLNFLEFEDFMLEVNA